MSDLTLFIGNKAYSSWSLRAWLMAKQSGLPFAEEVIPLYESGAPEDHARMREVSPSGKVPCLRHGDVTVWDSLAIGEYLAELAPASGLWPERAADRARARSISAEMHSGFLALRQNLTCNVRRRYPNWPVAEAAKPDIARIQAIWAEALRRSGGPFLFGGFSIADAMYAPVCTRFVTYDVALDDPSQAYVDRVMGTDWIRGWIEAAHAERWIVPRWEY